jgi:hypothetical protein
MPRVACLPVALLHEHRLKDLGRTLTSQCAADKGLDFLSLPPREPAFFHVGFAATASDLKTKCFAAISYELSRPATAATAEAVRIPDRNSPEAELLKFLLWLLLLVICWPIAVMAILLWPVVWLLLLPFRLVGLAVEGVFELLRALVTLPARLLRGNRTLPARQE